jgi:hypothetical protein
MQYIAAANTKQQIDKKHQKHTMRDRAAYIESKALLLILGV